MDVPDLSVDGSRRDSSYALDGGEMLGHLAEKALQGSFYGLDLHLKELDLGQKTAHLDRGSITKVGQAQGYPGCLLETLGSLHAQGASRSPLDHLSDLLQVEGSEFLSSSSPLEELPGAGDEDNGEEALVLGEDLIQHPQDSPLGIAHLINQLRAEAGQVSQRLEVRAGDIAGANPTDTQQVGYDPGISSVILDLADGGATVGMDLERVDRHHPEALVEEVVIQGKPVVSSSLQGDETGLGLMSKEIHQGCDTMSRMLEAEEAAYLVPFRIQEADLVGELPHVDAYRDHEKPPEAYLCGRAIPDSL